MSQSQISRRCFLQTATVASLGLAASPLLAADAKPADPFGGFALGIQSYTFRNFNLDQALKRTHDLGLKHIEITQLHLPSSASPRQIEAALKLCKEYDVMPNAYGVQHFSKDHEANKKIFAFAQALGVKSLSADPDPDSFDSLDKLVAETKIAIAIHPHGPVGSKLHRWYSADVILEAVKDHNPLIGSCLDTGHLIRADILKMKLDPAAEIRKMGKRNFGIHLKDNDNARKTNVVFGKGALDVVAVLKALREVQFTGSLSIEYEANPKDPTEDLKACVEVFKESVKKL